MPTFQFRLNNSRTQDTKKARAKEARLGEQESRSSKAQAQELKSQTKRNKSSTKQKTKGRKAKAGGKSRKPETEDQEEKKHRAAKLEDIEQKRSSSKAQAW